MSAGVHPISRAGRLRGAAAGDGAAAGPGRVLAGRGGADPERGQEEVPDQHLEDRRARRPGPPADQVRRGRGQPRASCRTDRCCSPPGVPTRPRRRTRTPSDVAALWLLPAAGGEARVVAALPGGVTAAEVARDAGAIVVGAPVLPAARAMATAPRTTPGCARSARTPGSPPSCTSPRRSGSGITTWGPTSPGCSPSIPTRCRKRRSGGPAGTRSRRWPTTAAEGAERAANPARLRDLTPEPGRALDGEAFELTPDGASVITGWWQWEPAGESHCELVAIDVASGKRRVLLSVPEYDFENPRVSPDGRYIACLRERHATGQPAGRRHRGPARRRRRGRGRRLRARP